MNIALVYDHLNKLGGAERILSALHQLYPTAPFYTSVANRHLFPDWNIITALPFKQHHELYPFLMPFVFESFDFSGFDVVISITSAEAKGIITSPRTLHLCYCLTPTRYLYSHAEFYQRQASWAKPVFKFLKSWDQVAATRPDHYLAISQTVQKRIKQYYRHNSTLIYPPVDTNFFRPTTRHAPRATSYFLIVSRLVPYKHLDLAIRACNELKLPLVVIGTGSQSGYLHRLAGPTIKFLGQVSDQELLNHYQHCQALIFPGREDFGLTMVEAQACGRPVVAFGQGGATEIIKNLKTGLFFAKLELPSLIYALKHLPQINFNSTTIRQNALRFSKTKFIHQFKTTINSLWHQHQKHLL